MRPFLLALTLMLTASAAHAQALWRNFFTTNQNPLVTVVAGSNATVQASTVGVNQRVFTVNAVPGSSGTASNVYGTNVIGAVPEATHATNADVATYAGYATNAGTATSGWPTNWSLSSITNANYLTNWQAFDTNVLGTLVQTNISYTAVTNAPWQWSSSVLSNLANYDGGELTNVPFSIFTNYSASPSVFTNVNGLAVATDMYGMTQYWTFATVGGVGPIAIWHNGIDTNTVITTNGGAFTGTIVDNSANTNSPANNQLVTAQWVRGLFAGAGVSYYVTTNINNSFTNSDLISTNVSVYEFSTDIPVYSRRTYVTPTNNTYIGSAVITNKVLQIGAGITVNGYFEALNGSGTGGPTIKAEIYVSYDGTNWFGDWDAQPQYIPEGATNLISWVISNPQYTSTNATGFYVERRYKVVTQTSPAASDILLHLGTNAPSHITLSTATSLSGNAYLAANQTFTGSNYFTTPLTLSLATNTPSANQVLTATSASTAAWQARVARSVGITVDGGGSAITSGTKGYIAVPYAGTIQSCTLMAQPSGSITFHLWRTNSADASFPPTAAGAIGTNSLSSDNYNVDSTLTGWTTSLSAGDVLGFNIPSAATTITNCTLLLKIQP